MERSELVLQIKRVFPRFELRDILRVEKCYACSNDHPVRECSLVITDCIRTEKHSYKDNKHFKGKDWGEVAAHFIKWADSVYLEPLSDDQDPDFVNRTAVPKEADPVVVVESIAERMSS